MKNQLKSIAIALVAFVSFTTQAQTEKKINTEKSAVHWVGKKVTGQHEGTLNFKDGALFFKDNVLAGGKFTVDMSTLKVTDLEGESAKNLEGHLGSDDFFSVEKYPTASLAFEKIANKGNGVYTIYANLTIKDTTNPIVFDITVDGSTATAKLVIDRTKYDIKYKSGSFFENLGDKAIYDDFELNVNLSF